MRLGALAAACSSAWPEIAAPTAQTELVRRGPARKVLILGAGLSGLVSAYYLTRAGHDVRILEARLRPGGRVHTLREPFSDDLYAEAGAARIPVAHSITLDWARHFKLEGGVSKCWDEDPWARGGAARVYPGHFDFLIGGLDPERRIHFAGEHLSAWSGWMQGALDSGARVAREVNDAAG